MRATPVPPAAPAARAQRLIRQVGGVFEVSGRENPAPAEAAAVSGRSVIVISCPPTTLLRKEP